MQSCHPCSLGMVLQKFVGLFKSKGLDPCFRSKVSCHLLKLIKNSGVGSFVPLICLISFPENVLLLFLPGTRERESLLDTRSKNQQNYSSCIQELEAYCFQKEPFSDLSCTPCCSSNCDQRSEGHEDRSSPPKPFLMRFSQFALKSVSDGGSTPLLKEPALAFVCPHT